MAFRKSVKQSLRNEYNNECSFCGYKEHPEVLEGAHIVPEHANPEATETLHGILLCPTCHSVLDRGLFTKEDFERFRQRKLNKLDPEMKRYFETGEWPSWAE